MSLRSSATFDVLKWSGLSEPEALLKLRERSKWYDPDVVAAVEVIVGSESALEMRKVRVKELTGKMILVDPVMTTNGLMLAAKGVDVTPSLRQRLINYSRRTPIQEPIAVFVRP